MSSQSRERKAGGALSMLDVDADTERQDAEQKEFDAPRRWRRKSGRTEVMGIRTTKEIRAMIIGMAQAQNKDIVDIIEEAVTMLHQAMKGKKNEQR